MNRRLQVYGLLLLTAAGLIYFSPTSQDDAVEAVKTGSNRVASIGRPSSEQLVPAVNPMSVRQFSFVARPDIVLEGTINLTPTPASQWGPPSQVESPANQPPPKPTAPPLPFSYFGRMVNLEGKTIFFVVNQQKKLISLERGEIIESLYKVDAIDASEIVFTYLPLKEKQVLPIQSASGNET